MSSAHRTQPQEASVIEAILKEMNITNFEPRVVAQLLDFSYQYVSDVLDDARIYSESAGKSMIDADDVKLAISFKTSTSLCGLPPKELIQEIAKDKNAIPLPPIREHAGLRLPPDRYCLLQPNFRVRKVEVGPKADEEMAPANRAGFEGSSQQQGPFKQQQEPAAASSGAGFSGFSGLGATASSSGFGGVPNNLDESRKRKHDVEVDEDYDDY